MIHIKKATTNNVAATLTEKTTISASPVYYLFSFTNDETKLVYTCIGASVANNERYNLLTIQEVASGANRTAGQITLKDTGFYHYEVYAQSSSTNLDPDQADEMVEQGKAEVTAVPSTINTYDSQPNTAKVYNG